MHAIQLRQGDISTLLIATKGSGDQGLWGYGGFGAPAGPGETLLFRQLAKMLRVQATYSIPFHAGGRIIKTMPDRCVTLSMALIGHALALIGLAQKARLILAQKA